MMIKRGDRVKVTARVAAAFNNKRRPGKLDWTDRRGLVERITTKKANAIVLWDGWQSVEDVPIRSIELEPKTAAPTMNRNRDDVLIWLWLAWCVALCGLAIWVIFPL